MSTREADINVYRERVFPILFMFIVTVVFIAMVSGVYLATRDTVIRNEQLYLRRAVLFAADIPIPNDAAALTQVYDNRIKEVRDANGDIAYYRVLDSAGSPVGYVIPTQGAGLWGEIQAVVGLKSDLKTLTGVDFVKQNETPGLGARITESWFRKQFVGKSGPFTMVPEGTTDAGPSQFDAITGATITSTAVRDILNKTTRQAPQLVSGGN